MNDSSLQSGEANCRITSFINNFADSFVERFLEEIRAVQHETTPLISAFDVFNPGSNKEERIAQFKILSDFYGEECCDIYNGHANTAGSIINQSLQQIELGDFDRINRNLLQNVRSEVLAKINNKLIQPEKSSEEIENNKPGPTDIYVALCKEGGFLRYPETMHLFKIALLVPPSTANVERSFSVLKLLVSKLRTRLNDSSVDQLMRICFDGPQRLSDDDIAAICEKWKAVGNRRMNI